MAKLIKINSLNHIEKEQLKKLYRESFPDDTEKDVDYFFNSYLQEVFVNDDFSSALYPVYKKLFFNGDIIDLPYVVAFGALREVRGKGIAAKLMNEFIKKSYTANVPFVALSPFNHEYYKRYGFVTVDAAAFNRDCDNCRLINCDERKVFLEAMQKIYCKAMLRYDNYIYRNQEDCKLVCDKLLTNGGKTILIVEDNNIINDNNDYINMIIDSRHLKVYGYSIECGNEILERLMCHNVKSEAIFENVQMRICDPVKAVNITKFNMSANDKTLREFKIKIKICDSVLGDKIYQFQIVEGKGNLVKTNECAEVVANIDEFTNFIINGAKIKGLPDGLIPNKKSFFIDKY